MFLKTEYLFGDSHNIYVSDDDRIIKLVLAISQRYKLNMYSIKLICNNKCIYGDNVRLLHQRNPKVKHIIKSDDVIYITLSVQRPILLLRTNRLIYIIFHIDDTIGDLKQYIMRKFKRLYNIYYNNRLVNDNTFKLIDFGLRPIFDGKLV